MPHPSINEIVTEDYRTALILDAYGIDFCYSGKKTLEEVSEEQHLDRHILEQALSNLNDLPPHWDYAAWDTKFLLEFIVHTHHNYIRETLPKLLLLCVKQHLVSEEYALFPYLLEMELARNNKQYFIAAENGRLEKPIHAIVKDHYRTVRNLKKIRELSQYFQPPHGACRECVIWYQLLREFDADMRLHIHLENNILFPRALALEAELSGRTDFTPVWIS